MPRFLHPTSPTARLHFLIMLKCFNKVLPKQDSGRILEAGTKQGHTSFWLARFYPYQVVGLDLNTMQIAENQRIANKLGLKNLSFIQQDLNQPLDLSHPFDLVLCSHVLEHIKADTTALKHLFYATATGGYLMLLVPGGINTVPHFSSQELKSLGHVRAGYTLDALKQKVEKSGFQVLAAKPAVGLWGTWANRLDYNLCYKSQSLIANAIGWGLASFFILLEYWLPIRPKWEILIVAQKVS